jgi:hypothetical protein
LSLGLSSGDVLGLDSKDHVTFMIQIFDEWFKRIVDPSKKSWRCVLTALDKAGFLALAAEVKLKLSLQSVIDK